MTREQQERIRQLRAAGDGYKKIGTLLNISVNTVKSFCRRDSVANGIETAEEKDAEQMPLCPRCHQPVAQISGHRKRVFCSSACRVAFWRIQAQTINTKNCLGCGRTLFGNDPRRKYCSHDCYIAHRFGRRNGGISE